MPCLNMANFQKHFPRFSHTGVWRFESSRPQRNTRLAADISIIYVVLIIQVWRSWRWGEEESWGLELRI